MDGLIERILAGFDPRGVVLFCDADALVAQQCANVFEAHTGVEKGDRKRVAESVAVSRGGRDSHLRSSS